MLKMRKKDAIQETLFGSNGSTTKIDFQKSKSRGLTTYREEIIGHNP